MYYHFLIQTLPRSTLIVLLVLGATLMIQTVHAQSSNDIVTSEQITLSKDLANNPVAQDILKKIEQTKKWIKELEDRKYGELQSKAELEAKRAQTLEKLNQDLKEWESLWEYYSPRNSFSRFVDTVQDTSIKDVFWDQFEFHQMKIGRMITIAALSGVKDRIKSIHHLGKLLFKTTSDAKFNEKLQEKLIKMGYRGKLGGDDDEE
jgi:hypothetical protein